MNNYQKSRDGSIQTGSRDNKVHVASLLLLKYSTIIQILVHNQCTDQSD